MYQGYGFNRSRGAKADAHIACPCSHTPSDPHLSSSSVARSSRLDNKIVTVFLDQMASAHGFGAIVEPSWIYESPERDAWCDTKKMTSNCLLTALLWLSRRDSAYV